MIGKAGIEKRKGAAAVEVVERLSKGILSLTDSEIRALFDLREEVDLIEVSRPLCVVLGNNHPAMIRMGKVTFK